MIRNQDHNFQSSIAITVLIAAIVVAGLAFASVAIAGPAAADAPDDFEPSGDPVVTDGDGTTDGVISFSVPDSSFPAEYDVTVTIDGDQTPSDFDEIDDNLEVEGFVGTIENEFGEEEDVVLFQIEGNDGLVTEYIEYDGSDGTIISEEGEINPDDGEGLFVRFENSDTSNHEITLDISSEEVSGGVDVSDLNIAGQVPPAEVVQGNDSDVTAEIENLEEDEPVTLDAALMIDDDEQATQEITIDPESQETVVFDEEPISDLQAQDESYEVTVEAREDGEVEAEESGDLTVNPIQPDIDAEASAIEPDAVEEGDVDTYTATVELTDLDSVDEGDVEVTLGDYDVDNDDLTETVSADFEDDTESVEVEFTDVEAPEPGFYDVNASVDNFDADVEPIPETNIDEINVEAPFFDVEITDVEPEPVTETQPVDVTAEINNTGQLEDTQDVVFEIDGDEEDVQEELTLTPDDDPETVEFTYETVEGDEPDVEAVVSTDDASDDRTITVDPVNAELNFNDQATSSTTITNDVTDPGVVVEDVDVNLDSAVVVTYEDNGDLVVAGVELRDAGDLDGSNVPVAVEDASEFPGEHTAHVIPQADLSDDYEAGETVSDDTAEAVLTNEDAVVFQGEVTIEDQEYGISTDTVNVSTSDLQPEAESGYKIFIHEEEDGSIGDVIGQSEELTGEQSEVEIDVDEIDETQTVYAMLHFPDDSKINNADGADGFADGGVVSAGEISIEQPATSELSNLDIAGDGDTVEIVDGDNESVSVDVENIGDLPGSFDVSLEIGDGDFEQTIESEELDAGDSETITFEDATGELTPGEYDVEVTTEDDDINGTLTVLEQPFFDVEIDQAESSDEIVAGDTAEIVAEINNTGEVEDTQTINLNVDGVSVDSDELTLDGGESQQVTLTNETDDDAVPSVEYELASDDDDDSITVDVLESATDSDVADLDIAGQGEDAEIEEGDEEDVTANVTNLGDTEASLTATLSVGGEDIATDTVTDIAAGDTEEVLFDDVTGDIEPGEYDVEVSTRHNSTTGTLNVLASAESELSELDIAGQGDFAELYNNTEGDITVDVENIGEVDDDFDVTLLIDDSAVDTETITVNASEMQTVTFDNVTGDLDADEYDVTIETDDDDLTGDLVIYENIDTELSDLDVAGDGFDATIDEGDNEDVSVVVANNDTADGATDVELTIENSDSISETQTFVEIADGDDETVTFADVTGGLDVDSYDVTVETETDTITGSLTVEDTARTGGGAGGGGGGGGAPAAPPADVDDDDDDVVDDDDDVVDDDDDVVDDDDDVIDDDDDVVDDDDDDVEDVDDETPGFGALVALVALIGAALLAIRRQP